MYQNEIAVFQQSIETCEDPAEIARKVKLAFKRMPGEMALACFAKVMTATLPHPIKVAVWDAVRYSHISPIATTRTPPAASPARKPLPLCWSVASIRPVATTSASAGTTSPGMWSGRRCEGVFKDIRMMVLNSGMGNGIMLPSTGD